MKTTSYRLTLAFLAFLIASSIGIHFVVSTGPWSWFYSFVSCVSATYIFIIYKKEKESSQRIAAFTGLPPTSKMAEHLKYIAQRETEVNAYIESLRNDTNPPPCNVLSTTSGTGANLVSLHKTMVDYKQEEVKRSWAQNGLAQFSTLMKNGNTIGEFCDLIISTMVRYMGVNQGAIFVEVHSNENRGLRLEGCFAYDRKKYMSRDIAEGEGLLGECMLAHQTIYMTNVPDGYTAITSGLGYGTPRCILIVPLMFQERFHGAIELAGFSVLEDHQVAFVERISEMIASEIATRNTIRDTEGLLNDSNRLARELQAHEEEMRQQMEELTATQEEMERKQAELNSVLAAINNTVASLEFDLEGNVLTANSNFSSIGGYAEHDIVVLNYKRLLPAAERGKPQHAIMWDNLRSGKFFAGEFRFASKKSEDMWLSGTFSPIFNGRGEPYKVLMIAQFTTQEKAKHHELSAIIGAAKSSSPYLEMDINLNCKSANEKFLTLFGIKRLELKNKNLTSLLPAGDVKKLQSAISNLSEKTEEIELEYNVNGDTLRIRTTLTPVRDQNQHVSKVIAFFTGDISRKQPVEL